MMTRRNSVDVTSGRSRHRRTAVVDELIRLQAPVFSAFYLEEPKLVFGGGNLSVDPKAGLETHGPFGIETAGLRIIRIAIIGTGSGIQDFLNFVTRCQNRIAAGFNKQRKPLDPLTFPDFPGCSVDHTFRSSFTCDAPVHRRIIRDQDFTTAIQKTTAQEKVAAVVELLAQQVIALAELENRPDVVVILLPASVENECAALGSSFIGKRLPLSVRERFERKLQKHERAGQMVFHLDFDAAEEADRTALRGFYNVHHAMKAHAMSTGLTTQLVWESTLRDPSLSSVAWNLFTALYYKSGNNPWQLQTLPENTCFVGISFYKESPHADAEMQTSLAQVFGAGDGLVLKGERAVFDRKRDRKAHLDELGSENLLARAIELYGRHHNGPPKRVVIHKTSRFWPEELRGFRKALGSIYQYDFLTLESSETRFLRVGKKPPLRGTVVQLAARNYLLFGNGYVPYLRCYPGKRLPRPLEILEHYGDSPAIDVCREILSLTKLNWNSCAFGSSEPITIRFARDVGKILAELPSGATPQSRYQFYM